MKRSLNIVLLCVVLGAILIYKKYYRGTAEKSKVLYLESPSMPTTLDPSMASDLVAIVEISKVYEGLLEYHYLKRPAELIPNLAESMPEISADGLTYTFKIKQGVYFQDNKCFPNGKAREVVAEDFVYSFMRVADPKLQSPLFSLVTGKIEGLDEWRKKYTDSDSANYSDSIKGIQAIDKYTLRIVLTRPWPQFLHTLTMPHTFVIPKEAVDHYDREFSNRPVGTGPFIIKEFNPQENKIVAYKNPTFREKLYPSEASEECKHLLSYAGKKLPFLDVVETVIINEEQPRWLKFVSQKLDALFLYRMSDLSKKIKGNEPNDELKSKGVLFMRRPSSTTGMYVLNNRTKPFVGNKYLRQAISMAYDRKKANELFNDGLSEIAQSIIPPTLAGYEQEFINVNNIYNLEEAKKLLAKAGYPGGKGLDPITIDVTGDTRARQSAEFFQKCMEKIGVKINISPNSWPELMDKVHHSKTQISVYAWLADYPDAENFLELFYKGDERQPSTGSYRNHEYDKLYEKASIMQDSPERTKLYEEMNRMLADEVPVLFTNHSSAMYFYYSWVINYEYFDPKRCDLIQYLDIDTEKRDKMMNKK
jgi:oligopeptide transport system substrate-binding protein